MEIKTITEIINQKGYEAEVKDITKGSIIKQGIQIGTGNIRVVIYPESFEGTDEEIADQIIKIYESNSKPAFSTDGITDINYIKEHAFISARRPVADDKFTKDYLDIQLVIRVKVNTEDGCTASFMLSKDLAKALDITEDIFDEAIKHMEFEFKPMGAMISEEVGSECLLTEKLNDCGMFVISTKERLFGAAALYDKLLLKSISFLLDSDLVIVPSSTQELIVMKYDENNMNLADMNATVNVVNTTQVDPTEQLSDHVYVYTKDSGSLTW